MNGVCDDIPTELIAEIREWVSDVATYEISEKKIVEYARRVVRMQKTISESQDKWNQARNSAPPPLFHLIKNLSSIRKNLDSLQTISESSLKHLKYGENQTNNTELIEHIEKLRNVTDSFLDKYACLASRARKPDERSEKHRAYDLALRAAGTVLNQGGQNKVGIAAARLAARQLSYSLPGFKMSSTRASAMLEFWKARRRRGRTRKKS